MRTRLRYAVVPVAAALLLAGCGRPGTAATVDGRRITDAQVAAMVADLTKLNGSPATPQSAINSMVVSHAVLELATEAGVGVSEQQGRDLLDATVTQAGGTPWDYSEEILLAAQMEVAVQKADTELSDQIGDAVAALDVTVNPRFGTWDPTAGVQDPSWPWLISGDADAEAAG